MGTPIEISVTEAANLLKKDRQARLVDVRTAAEYARAKIDGALLVSRPEDMHGLLSWPRDTRIVVHCHHGFRSLDAVAFLRGQGFLQAQSLAGGIDAWSRQVDPRVPRY